MKPQTPIDLRPVLAAGLLLAVLAGAYEAAQRLPPMPIASRAAAPARAKLPADAADPDTVSVTSDLVPAVPQAEPVVHCPSEPIRFVPPDLSERLPLGLHRYVGTVGGQAATALLGWHTPHDGASGIFYLHRGGPLYEVDFWNWNESQAVLQISTLDGSDTEESAWFMTGLPGAVLRGTWVNDTGRHPFVLRESYAGAVRATVHTLQLKGGQAKRPYSSQECEAGSYVYEFLQLPASRVVAPALRRALNPLPAAVRSRMQATYEELHNQQRALGNFLLNDFNLLSYQIGRGRSFTGDSSRYDHWSESYLFDLLTGRELTLASQLRPGYERALRRLVRRHLLHDSQFDFINREHRASWDWRDAASKATNLVALPAASRYDDNGHASGLCLTGSGLQATYPSEELYSPHKPDEQEYTINVPYAELRPLVRPGTPLARMLRARGLW
ncbi:MAG: hypothetical protein ACRYFX_00360 [Janthinobacterium lividum]